eukprot:1405110-Amphidinium_carterae.1
MSVCTAECDPSTFRDAMGFGQTCQQHLFVLSKLDSDSSVQNELDILQNHSYGPWSITSVLPCKSNLQM